MQFSENLLFFLLHKEKMAGIMECEIRAMKKKVIYILVIAGAIAIGAIIAFTIFATTNSSFRRTTLGRIVRWCMRQGIDVQKAEDLAEDIKKKIGAVKLQAWCEETMTRYKASELLTDGNSPYWSAGDITLADEEIPEFIKNVWPIQQHATLQHQPDVSIYIANDGDPKYMAISWYDCGVMVGPLDYVENYGYSYLRQVKPSVYVYGVEK
jgi:hypothetical protein